MPSSRARSSATSRSWRRASARRACSSRSSSASSVRIATRSSPANAVSAPRRWRGSTRSRPSSSTSTISEQLEIALIENIQRKDLTPFEEAEGFYVLQQKFGYTHEKISQVIGKSRTTITETLAHQRHPGPHPRHVPRGGDLEQVACSCRSRAPDPRKRWSRSCARTRQGRCRARISAARPHRSRSRRRRGVRRTYVFALKDKALPFTLNLAFRKPNVEKREVIDAVRELLRRLESEG